MSPVLELDRLSLSFGGLRALSELDLQVREREVRAGRPTSSPGWGSRARSRRCGCS